jgi:hypothetical protein
MGGLSLGHELLDPLFVPIPWFDWAMFGIGGEQRCVGCCCMSLHRRRQKGHDFWEWTIEKKAVREREPVGGWFSSIFLPSRQLVRVPLTLFGAAVLVDPRLFGSNSQQISHHTDHPRRQKIPFVVVVHLTMWCGDDEWQQAVNLDLVVTQWKRTADEHANQSADSETRSTIRQTRKSEPDRTRDDSKLVHTHSTIKPRKLNLPFGAGAHRSELNSIRALSVGDR